MNNQSAIKALLDEKGLSIFCPAYNEEENIEICITNMMNFLKNLTENFEIIIVDDGSTDKTPQIADELSKRYSPVKVIHHPHNKGYGAAIKTGFSHCKKDLIFYTDSDNQFDIKEITVFLEKIQLYDMVIGYRAKRKDPWMRLLYSKVYKMVIFFVMNLKLKDVDCSFKLFRREVIDSFELYTDTGSIDLEILYKAVQKKFSFCEIPVTHYPRTKGAVSFEYFRLGGFSPVKPRAIINLLRDMLIVKRKDKGT